MSQRAAGTKYKTPRATRGNYLSGDSITGVKPGPCPKLPYHLEEKLVAYATTRANLGIGFGKTHLMKYVSLLTKKYRVNFKHFFLVVPQQKIGGDCSRNGIEKWF